MGNPILERIRRLSGGNGGPETVDPVWLLTLLTVQEVGRYSLAEWNAALSAVLGRRVFCPSYRALERYLQDAVLEVQWG